MLGGRPVTTRTRLATNVAGEFFVDSSCIDCDTCRWMAPGVFDQAGDHSRVHRQPANAAEVLAAERALLACPTGSIRTEAKHDLAAARSSFPLLVDEDVYHCGYHSEASFGATSYLVRRPPERGGNVLIDSPRWNQGLIERIEELGGVRTLFLTHGDDVAEHARLARHFGCERVMHAGDAVPGVERVLAGLEPVVLDPELRVIPTPGHTEGSACLLYRERFLFTGDHLAWSETRGHLYAFRTATWFDWKTQIRSMERLARERFEWVLPGHGRRAHVPLPAMREEMERCVTWMKARA
jgi:glyoxylase-like metal-dependent hydrolase (beta-lactamase superfamily II)/ferredoxin